MHVCVPPSASEALPAAAIVHGDAATDGLLADFARDMLARGHRLCGLLQMADCGCEANGSRPALVDLRSGHRYPLFQALGSGSRSCRLDPQGVAEASGVLRDALALRAELVIVNRFGAQEVAGKGFVHEMLALMSEGIPLLTVVADKHLAGWRRFTGGAAAEIPSRREALQAWFERVCGGRI